MTKHSFSLAIVVLTLSTLAAPAFAQKTPTADAVMQKVVNKLSSLKVLGYIYARELNYASEGYLSKTVTAGYMDFNHKESALGFRFQFSDDEILAIYNGTESFVAAKKKKIIQVRNSQTLKSFDGFASFYNSPLTLKYVLPKIIADKSIPRKITVAKVDGRNSYVIEFTLQNRTISTIGEIAPLRNERKSIYRVTVDAKTYLPVEVLLTNGENKDFTKTSFSNMTENPPAPSDLSWYYSSYTDEYKPDKSVDLTPIQVGQTPPALVLKQFESGSPISLEQYKGKVVLIEFWIAHCGFCIAAVPKLNQIARAFKDRDFQLISVNMYDPGQTIDLFKSKNAPEFPILIEGEAAAISYGVGSYPGLVLIGKDGKVAYSALGLDMKALEAAITASLDK
jgi:thiol-disulfide isomerase/thioredoxin